MKYHLITLGCQMNLSDSERVSAVLEGMGYDRTEREEDAALLGILACSVRQKPIDKVYNKIAQWNRWKNSRNLITFLSGCVLAADREKLLRQFDIVFPMSELGQLPDVIRQYGVVNAASLHAGAVTSVTSATSAFSATPATLAPSVQEDTGVKPAFRPPAAVVMPKNEHIERLWQIRPRYRSTYEAFVPIQNGCDKFCTFCAVPYTRGREVSRPSADIMDEVCRLVSRGYKSITLLGQNVNSYGLDKDGREIGFAALLRQIGEFGEASGEEFWVYFTSPHPHDMTREVIETIARYPCLARQIHLPMQSGDEKVLIRMNRKHSMEKYRKIVQDIRELLPGATLFTDVIVGFTGEGEPEFNNTVAAFHEFRFNMAFIAMYSPRPGAASYRWQDDVSQDVKKDRLHRLSEVLRGYTRQYNEQLVGKTVKVLINGADRKTGFSAGLTEGKLNIRLNGVYPELTGRIRKVKVTAAADFSLSGDLVTEEEKVEA